MTDSPISFVSFGKGPSNLSTTLTGPWFRYGGLTGWWWWAPCWRGKQPRCHRRRTERGDRECRLRSKTRRCSATPSAAGWRRRRASRSRPDWGRTPSWRAIAIYGFEPKPPQSVNYLWFDFIIAKRNVDFIIGWLKQRKLALEMWANYSCHW